ncbi:hypothetical protein Bpfe_030332 [Biomphalaria pfeifferi]|uniref:Uncharacterized protein n=1 Tax=Biomphalaria pfeifferi TaxID=112525 RepID=A0AAD8AQ14_BIOPF|nr:hypothetical protein Bpfe_030332 [Biomphalaria pfeifferi]
MIHIHTGGGFSSGLGRKYPNSLNHADWKAPLRCGFLFCTFSCVLFVIGVILTWLGIRRSVHDVFGETVPITGPILLFVGGLMLLLATRQFYLAHTRKRLSCKSPVDKEQGQGQTVVTATTDHDDDQDFSESANLNKKTYRDNEDDHDEGHDDIGEHAPLNKPSYYDHATTASPCNEALISGGGYVWSPGTVQSPYLSMAMMVHKDPALTYGPFISATSGLAHTDSYNPGLLAADVSDTTAEQGAVAACGRTLPRQASLGTAVLETVSTTLRPPQATTASSSSPADTAASSCQPDVHRIFPSDYLNQYQRNASSPNPATVGISSLPSSTAFMMIRTLELQETI